MTGRTTILVVEDDPLVSEIVAAALEDDYEIAAAGTSAEALAALRAGGTGLMLLDCTLPGGVDPLLIAEADRAGVRIVLMSGDSGRARTVAGAARAFLLKPFTLTALADIVASALSDRAQAR